MKCLSLWQPWSTLLVVGAKRCETRSWQIRHRGGLLIHAAKKWDKDLLRLARSEPFRSALEVAGYYPDYLTLPKGAIVGRVDVVACYPTERVFVGESPDLFVPVPTFDESAVTIGERERAFGDYGPGRFAFLCSSPVPFAEPIPFRGQQGFFDVPGDLIKE